MEISCTICLTSMTSSDELQGTLCGHVCHSACMIDWLKRSQTCPQCRRAVHHRDVGRIYLNFTNSDNSLMESVLNNHQTELDHLQSVLHQKTDVIANYEQQLKDFHGILLQRDQELQKKDAFIGIYQSQLKGLESRLEVKDLQLQEKSTIIADHQRELKDLLSRVQLRDQQIKQKDQQMQQKDQQMQQKDQQMQQKDQQMQQKDQQMHQNAAIIANHQRELENLLSLVQQRTRQLQEKTAIIGNLENEIKKKDQNNTEQITVIENLNKQIEADQRYFQPQLALQQARISELEMRNQLTSGQVVADTKRVTSESEKYIKLEECVADLSKKLSDECAKSRMQSRTLHIASSPLFTFTKASSMRKPTSINILPRGGSFVKSEKCNLEQHLRMCDRQKLELQARLVSLEKQLELKEEKTKNVSQYNTKKRTSNVSSNVKSELNLVQSKVEPNASGSKTNKRATRAPLGTINQNSEQTRYNLRPR